MDTIFSLAVLALFYSFPINFLNFYTLLRQVKRKKIELFDHLMYFDGKFMSEGFRNFYVNLLRNTSFPGGLTFFRPRPLKYFFTSDDSGSLRILIHKIIARIFIPVFFVSFFTIIYFILDWLV